MKKNNQNDNEFFFVVSDLESYSEKETDLSSPEIETTEEKEEPHENAGEMDDIVSSSEGVMEDIMSHSSPEVKDLFDNIESDSDFSYGDFNEDFEETPSHKGKHSKEKRGFGKWWRSLHTGYKVLIISLLSILILLGSAYAVLRLRYNINHEELDPTDLGFKEVIDKNIINIALFGVDTRSPKSFEGNSDSIMILSLNTVTKKVKIISVMRDTLVPIYKDKDNKKAEYKKINSAYGSGQQQLAVKTLNQIFQLDISEYAIVNFYGMIEIIDAIGGIDAELTADEVVTGRYTKALNGCIDELCRKKGIKPDKYYITTPGKHHLNGIQAVAYSRIRIGRSIWGTNNDYGRTDRQRYVMEQMFNKAVKMNSLSEYERLIRALLPCSKTSLYYDEIFELCRKILMQSPKFEQARIPTPEYEIYPAPQTSAGSVVYFDLEYAAKVVHAFIYNDITPENYIKANGVEKNDWYYDIPGHYRPSYQAPSGGDSSNTTPSDPSDTPGTPTDPNDQTGEIPPEGDGTEPPTDGDGTEPPTDGDGTEPPTDGDGNEIPPTGDGSGTETPPSGDGGGTETPPAGDGGGAETPPAGDGGGTGTEPTPPTDGGASGGTSDSPT